MKPVSETVLRDIWNYDFNLSFKESHTNTCKTCDSIKINLGNKDSPADERKKFEELQSEHEALKHKIAGEFKRDIQNASDDTMVLTFGIQKVLETPSLTTIIAFYKR